MNYQESLLYLDSISSRGVKPGQERVSAILDALHRPQDSYPSVLVGGTNGKGSVCTFLSSILCKSGLRTGLHTKPHITGPEERIIVNGKILDKRKFSRYLTGIRKECEDRHIEATYFEVLAVLAVYAFAEEKVDIAVVEVGLGGRLDATNVLDPVLSIVTNVDSDHSDRLGTDLAEVARDKAAISRKNRPFVTNAPNPELAEILFSESLKKGAEFIFAGDYIKVESKNSGLCLCFPDKSEIIVKLKMKGDFQNENMVTAVTAALKLKERGFPVTESSIKDGLETAFIHGRFETILTSPLVILDGAHNVPAAKILKRNIDSMNFAKKILVIGMMRDKDVNGYLSVMKNSFDIHIFVTIDYFRAMKADELAAIASGIGYKCIETFDCSEKGVKYALIKAGENDLICITGSLYLAGEVKKQFRKIIREKIINL